MNDSRKLSMLEIARQKACGEMPCDAGCGEGGHVKACERVASAVVAEVRAMLPTDAIKVAEACMVHHPYEWGHPHRVALRELIELFADREAK